MEEPASFNFPVLFGHFAKLWIEQRSLEFCRVSHLDHGVSIGKSGYVDCFNVVEAFIKSRKLSGESLLRSEYLFHSIESVGWETPMYLRAAKEHIHVIVLALTFNGDDGRYGRGVMKVVVALFSSKSRQNARADCKICRSAGRYYCPVANITVPTIEAA